MAECDVLFIGGGLSALLSAYRLQQRLPHLRVAIWEKSAQLAGEHTWSFHESDLTPEQNRWITPLVSHRWPGYDVRFPLLTRTLSQSYCSIRSSQLRTFFLREFRGSVLLNHEATPELSENEARWVFDCRGGWPSTGAPGGYQKFFGLFLRTETPHGQTRPVLMDATCEQLDGFRFFYTLPWDEHHLLVEDTYYSTEPSLDYGRSREAVVRYTEMNYGRVASIESEERGSLPIPLALPQANALSPWALGMRGMYFHPTTGYSLPDAVRGADNLADILELPNPNIEATLRGRQTRQLRNGRFYCLLNRMLFLAAPEQTRYKVLERFYTLSQPTIARFYAGRLKGWDILRILGGKPPVPIGRALLAAWGADS